MTIKGKSQAGSAVRLQNGANGAIATVTAGKDGLWETVIAVANGTQRDHDHRGRPGGQREHRPSSGCVKGSGRHDGGAHRVRLPVPGVEAAQAR